MSIEQVLGKEDLIREVDRMFSVVRGTENMSDEERAVKLNELFEKFIQLDQRRKDVLMKRNLHSLFFSFLKRNDIKCMHVLALNVDRNYEFRGEDKHATIAALCQGYMSENDPNKKGALLDCLFAVARGRGNENYAESFERAIALASERNPRAVESIRQVYENIIGPRC